MKKLKDILKESNVQIGKVYSNPYAKSFVKEEEEERPQAEELTTEQKHAFLEAVKQFKKYGEAVYRNAGLGEVYKSIKNMVEMAGKVTLSETDDWFDNVTVSRHMKRMGESFKVFEKTLKEVSTLQQRLEASYDEIGEVLGKYYEINEMEDEIEEGNEFGAARAKAIANGDDSFEVDGKKYPVKDVDADDKENAKEFSNESMKLSDMIKKPSVNEAALPKDGSIIKVSNIPVKIEYVSSKKYIGYSWKDKNNKEHYEETKVSEHSDLNSLIKTIASEIRYQQIHKNESMKLTDMISVNEIKKGSVVIPYAMDKHGEFIVDKVFKNKDGETSYTGKFKKNGEHREFILHSKDRIVKESVNEDVWTSTQKKQVEKLDNEFRNLLAKKGIEPYSYTASKMWKSAGFQKNFQQIFQKDESVSEASEEFVVYVEKDNGRKKLLHTKQSQRAANMFLTKNADKILNQSGIRTIGSMSKFHWEKDEAQYAENIKKTDMKTVTKKEWDAKHNDYKGMIKGKPYMMWFDKKTQSTVYGPVNIVESVVNEAQKINPTSMKFLKGMKKIKVKGLGGYMPGVNYLYVDGDKYYFVDTEGDHMELRNNATIKQLKKVHGSELGESAVNEAKYDIGMARKGNGITVYNRAEEEKGDYKNVAHISDNGTVKYFDKKLPNDVKKKIEAEAQKMKESVNEGTKMIKLKNLLNESFGFGELPSDKLMKMKVSAKDMLDSVNPKKVNESSEEDVVEEGSASTTKLLQSVVNGETSRVEGIKLSKEMAQSFIDWIRISPYGKKYGNLPFYMLFKASFNWGLNRHADKKSKEYKELEAKAKKMSFYPSDKTSESVNEGKAKEMGKK